MRRHVPLKCLLILFCGACSLLAHALEPPHATVRFATLNAAMGLATEGELARRLAGDEDPALRRLAEILQRVRPDVLLLNEFDFQANVDAADLLRTNYLQHAEGELQPVHYPFAYAGPVNTGVPSGLDLDGNGRAGDPGDAWGFGRFPGQYGMLVLSRYPLDTAAMRSFQHFLWKDMPGALKPVHPDGADFYPADTWAHIRLSSKSHWDLPVTIGGQVIHFLVSHPTPPVFDGPEDRNGRRNHDEIRLWTDYVRPGAGDYLVDDAGRAGGLDANARFVIAGDQNADPEDGDSTGRAILQLLQHERIDARCIPTSYGSVEAGVLQGGANKHQRGNAAADTSDMNDATVGNLRIDYVLPSTGLEVAGCGVFWPADGEPGQEASGFSDHRLVWLDLRLP